MSDPEQWTVQAIGRVSSTRSEVLDDDWGTVEATISLLPPLGEAALLGLDEFSHIEVVYLFDRVDPAAVHVGSRHPRDNPDWPEVGVLAQRVKNRPNRIGVSRCELVSIHGTDLVVRGLDAIDGTRVLDIKPYMVEFGPRGEVRQPTWASQLMSGYY
jgi:tRNA (adenine37-N6)-methyltransferase